MRAHLGQRYKRGLLFIGLPCLLVGLAIALWLARDRRRTGNSGLEIEERASLSHVFQFRKPPRAGVLFVGTNWLGVPCASAGSEDGFSPGGFLGVPIVAWVPSRNGPDVIRNDMENLSANDVQRLPGLSVSAWSDAVARSLAGVDARRTCMTADADRVSLRNLPADTAMLVVQWQHVRSRRLEFSRFTDLRYLRVEGPLEADQEQTIDAATLTAPDLEHLRLAGRIENAPALARFTAVRELDLRGATGIENLDFVREMKDLETLRVRAVKDLRPVGGLAHLTFIDAEGSDVSELPMVAMPALRSLELLSSRVPAEQIEWFQRQNLQCRIRRSFNAELRAAIKGATQVRILQEGRRQTTVVINSGAEIAALQSLLKLDDDMGKGTKCRCLGDVRLEVVTPAGIQRIAPVCRRWLRLEGHNRAVSQWSIDPALTPESLAAFRQWVEKQGARWACCGEEPAPGDTGRSPGHDAR